jgi:hypothetical protein
LHKVNYLAEYRISATDHLAIRQIIARLNHIRETDKKQIQFVLHHCETDEGMRDFAFEEACHLYESEGEEKS